MGIKLSDFIKDTHNVFTQEEAEMIYLAAGYVNLGNECYLEQTSSQVINLPKQIAFEQIYKGC